jgi:hypothetical protein
VYKSLPTVVELERVEVEYFKEYLFWKHLDCSLAYYVAMISGTCGGAEQKGIQYLDPVLLISPPSGDMRA